MSVKQVYILGEDGRTGRAVADRLQELDDYQRTSRLSEADLVVTSPGVPPDQYPRTSVPIISEIEFAFQLNPTPVIAVSGTNAKSTTTAKIAHMLDIPFAGNIGVPYISRTDSYDFISVEVSSYQLFSTRTFKPKIAVLLNISPDHLKWHGSFDNYLAAKARIFANQDSEDYLVYNRDDPLLAELVCSARSKLLPFSAEHKLDQSQQAAARVWEIIHPDDPQGFSRALKDFKGLEHRFELVDDFEGVRVINDSKATNPESTLAALEVFEPGSQLIVILGGREKGTDLSQLKEQLAAKACTIVLTGESMANFAANFKGLPLHQEPDFGTAVKKALELAGPGSTVLLSPAAASFDSFNSFEHRGERFKQIVRQYYQKQ